MKVLVCGGRDYWDRVAVKRELDSLGVTMIIEGGASGADRLASLWAVENGIHSARVEARWFYFGKSAGHKRNAAMLLLQPDLVVAFPGGRGTENMILQAERAGIPVKRITAGETP